MYFEANFIPFSASLLSFQKRVIIIPAIIAIIGPPITGNFFPRVHDGRAIIKHINKPSQFFDINFLNEFIIRSILSGYFNSMIIVQEREKI